MADIESDDNVSRPQFSRTQFSRTQFSRTMEIIKVASHPSGSMEEAKDEVSIEEPLEIMIDVEGGSTFSIGITMRTPGNDEDLVAGLLMTEGIIKQINELTQISFTGPVTASYGLKNKVVVRISSQKPVDEKKFQRYFLTNSSCGICGKTAIDTLEFLHKPAFKASIP